MVTVLINADDLGLHPAVTRAVRRFSEKGSLHSASVMANGPYVEDALFLASNVLLGAHLNILRGKPILHPRKIPSLVNSDGLFLGSYVALFRRYITNTLNLDEVRHEWDAQIKRLKGMGLFLVHIDSEKHIHAWPKLMPIAYQLAVKHNIPRVRLPHERAFGFPRSLGYFRAGLIRYWLNKTPKECHEKFTIPNLWGLQNQGESFSYNAFRSYIKNNPDITTIEIACHPGIVRSDDPPLHPEFGKTRVDTLWGPEAWSLENEAWPYVDC